MPRWKHCVVIMLIVTPISNFTHSTHHRCTNVLSHWRCVYDELLSQFSKLRCTLVVSLGSCDPVNEVVVSGGLGVVFCRAGEYFFAFGFSVDWQKLLALVPLLISHFEIKVSALALKASFF